MNDPEYSSLELARQKVKQMLIDDAEKNPPEDTVFTVEIVNKQLVIRVGLGILQFAAEHNPDAEIMDPVSLEFYTPQVTDIAKFGQEVVDALCSEKEDGSTLVTRMFDNVFDKIGNSGGEGYISAEEVRDIDQHKDSNR